MCPSKDSYMATYGRQTQSPPHLRSLRGCLRLPLLLLLLLLLLGLGSGREELLLLLLERIALLLLPPLLLLLPAPFGLTLLFGAPLLSRLGLPLTLLR